MPGKARHWRRLPLNLGTRQIKEIFLVIGFDVVEWPSEKIYSILGFEHSKNHPTRDTHDTFYISENVLLRDPNVPLQYVQGTRKTPIPSCAGKVTVGCRRRTHSPLFHHKEGLVVDVNVTMSELKGTLDTFAALLRRGYCYTFRRYHFFYRASQKWIS
jgi:phenylalanyl-tRNA synthetase alpha chain